MAMSVGDQSSILISFPVKNFTISVSWIVRGIKAPAVRTANFRILKDWTLHIPITTEYISYEETMK
jgi:hypothetical protein